MHQHSTKCLPPAGDRGTGPHLHDGGLVCGTGVLVHRRILHIAHQLSERTPRSWHCHACFSCRLTALQHRHCSTESQPLQSPAPWGSSACCSRGPHLSRLLVLEGDLAAHAADQAPVGALRLLVLELPGDDCPQERGAHPIPAPQGLVAQQDQPTTPAGMAALTQHWGHAAKTAAAKGVQTALAAEAQQTRGTQWAGDEPCQDAAAELCTYQVTLN